MVGDFVTYAGVTTGAGFFAAYEIVSNVAVYTKVRLQLPTLRRITDDVTSFLAERSYHAIIPHC